MQSLLAVKVGDFRTRGSGPVRQRADLHEHRTSALSILASNALCDLLQALTSLRQRSMESTSTPAHWITPTQLTI